MANRNAEESREFSFETAEERDLYQYFQLPFSQHFSPDHVQRSESDITLSAFAQLANLRLNTTRAFISLVDWTSQYILVEATQKSCLLADSVHNDENLWYGRTTLPRSLGLCGNALEILSRQDGVRHESRGPSPLIIDDLTQDDGFKDHPFVTSHPSLRFYAAMPISTKSGFNIGTLSVMDERPREGLGDAEIKFLCDIAVTIMAYFETTRAREGHRRSEKMIRGLGVFMEGRTALDDWWPELGSDKSRRHHGPADSAEAGSKKRKDQPDSDLTSASKRHHSPKRTIEPEVPGLSISLDCHSHVPNPKLSMPTPARAKVDDAAELLSASTAQSDGDAIPAASTSRSQETLSLGSPTPTVSATLNSAHMMSPMPSGGQGQQPAGLKRTFTPDLQENLLSQSLKAMFSRASKILQEAIEVDGAIFLDASTGPLGGRKGSIISSGEEERSQTRTGGAESSEVSSAGSDVSQLSENTLAQRRGVAQKTCGVLGFWTGGKSSLHRDGTSGFVPPTEVFLQSLLHKYPHGHVFNPSDRSRAISGMKDPGRSLGDEAKTEPRSSQKKTRNPKEIAEHAEAKALLRMLPGARSVAFVPLWDSHRERWFAGSFAWTAQQTTRVLTRTEDLNYLAAFGNSIMAEVTRLDAMGADQAKSDFISSISHELRSPLHGILASVEFLQDTTVDLFQHSMIDTIERCGRTLLDTIQHVLDFAKINNFTRSKRSRREEPHSGLPGLSVDIDLSLLTEDVIDSVFAGHEFQGNSSLVVTDEASGFPPEGLRRSSVKERDGATVPNRPGLRKERLDVIMDIGWRSNWAFNTQSGALRRVLMNLFGNALKYTSMGWVKVSLQSKDIDPPPSQPQQSIITISVSDSGRGIAQEYLHSGLFTPFTQENPLNPGTGLGLSIVLQIVRSLGGKIDITSEQGVGTEVVVSLTLDQASSADPLPLDREGEHLINSVRKKTSGLNLGLVGFDANSGIPDRRAGGGKAKPEPSSFLQASLGGMATHWFDMKVTAPETWKASPPDIYIANETLGLHGAFSRAPTIVLCSHESLYRKYSQRTVRGDQRSNSGLVHFVSKPCGPHKLAKAFAFCLGNASHLPMNFESQSSSPGVPYGALASPQSLFRMSPEEQMHRREHFREEYFPPEKPSGTNESLAPAADDTNTLKQKPLLLLVEDNRINLQLLSAFAKKNNYEYDTAENGLKALQAFQNTQKPYDIVFMDISMPVMDGMEATREIRKLERDRRQKPALIIALTGLGSATSQQEAFSNGINLFLTKPARFNDLRKILNDWTSDMEMQSHGI